MKKTIAIVVLSMMILGLFIFGVAEKDGAYGRSAVENYKKYSYFFLGTFDTMIEISGYTKSQEEFENMAIKVQNRFEELHKLFDIYNEYDGINNIKTINNLAGIKPVEVADEIIQLLIESKKWYFETKGKFDITLGPLLEIWHDYRTRGNADPYMARLPSMDLLGSAYEKADMDKLIIDENGRTVFLKDGGMSLDVGAIAKGYATELVANELIGEGFDSFILSGGGNIKVVGEPRDKLRKKWGVGIQDPDETSMAPQGKTIDILYVNDTSVVTSGDYQRYYYVEDKMYHHIIDPDTLMPADFFKSVVIMTPDSGQADALSTAIFCMPLEEGEQMAEELGNVEVLWIMKDGQVITTSGMKENLKGLGGAKNK